MSVKLLTLKCPNCSASLEIFPDMDSFACGYCGSQQMVQRRGGTILLKLVTDAIEKVQHGTDRTASELAIQRLTKEIGVIVTQRQHLSASYPNTGSAVLFIYACGFLLLGGALRADGFADDLGMSADVFAEALGTRALLCFWLFLFANIQDAPGAYSSPAYFKYTAMLLHSQESTMSLHCMPRRHAFRRRCQSLPDCLDLLSVL
jgi:DNA-directed RNA polymerase subunit RPC12/RpoP